jgi:CRP-like cAMP-binding protein
VEVAALKGASWRFQEFDAETEIVAQYAEPSESGLLISGFAGRALYTECGKRQICALHILGDFIGLHGFYLKVMDHAVVALTPCRIAFVQNVTLQEITETYPHLSRMLAMTVAIDAAIGRNWIINRGRQKGEVMMASFLCGVFKRFEVVGATTGSSFPFPLTQATLGDALGLTSVHTNRVLQALRATGYITWDNGTITIHDWDALASFAGFDPTYLNIVDRKR